MASYPAFDDRTFQGAEAFLAKGRNPDSRPIANNTRLVRRGPDAVAVTLHQTDVVAYHRDGTQTVCMGGWPTVTTRERINRFSAARVRVRRTRHCVWHPDDPTGQPLIRKCHMCKGSGEVTPLCAGPGWCYGGGCGHRHVSCRDDACAQSHRLGSCEHGEPAARALPARGCWGCEGHGRRDCGSQPIPTEFDVWDRVRVDATGKVIGVSTGAAPSPGAPFEGISGRTVRSALAGAVPDFRASVRCPACGSARARDPLEDIVVHLNDTHRWSRERIADWLESLDLDLRFRTPGERERKAAA